MTWLLTFADLALALTLFWHSANNPDRDPVQRALLYALAFSLTSFGAARFLALVGAPAPSFQWMIDLGHASLVAFAAIKVGQEIGRMAKLKGN